MADTERRSITEVARVGREVSQAVRSFIKSAAEPKAKAK
jgi:hypothetical protein